MEIFLPIRLLILLMQEHQQETRSGRFITRQEHALAELAKRELARQSAKGAK